MHSASSLLALRFVIGLSIMGGLMRVCSLLFFKKGSEAWSVAGLAEKVGTKARLFVIAVLGASAVPPLLRATYEDFGVLVWGLRLAALACASGSLLLLWLAFAPRKRR
jgi:hypothetical protein